MNRRRCATAAALLLSCLFATSVEAATGRAECNSLPSKILERSIPYCVLLPPSYDAEKSRRYPVLYFLHGLGDNEQFFIHTGGFNLVEDLWEQHQLADFLIVTAQGGTSFYINSHDGRHLYEDFFREEFLPGIEQRYRAETGRANRGIAGISMGGYGALHIAFRHPQLFRAVAVHSAALLENLPSIGAEGGSPQITALRRILGGAFGTPFDPAFWNRNDPLRIAREANLLGLKIYFDCGSEDDYGFDGGAQALDRLLTARHIAHEYHLYSGGHDWTYFAQHLPASLEFESRALTSAATHAKETP
jgi:S-formylglutathione hydrolase FrmB